MLDANILVRGALGTRVSELLDAYDDVLFFAPDEAFADARRHLPVIAEKRGFDVAPLLASLDDLAEIVWEIGKDTYEGVRSIALPRIEQRDPDDWTVIAVALVLACPIWTEDHDFFGTGMPTWTTDRVELYLSGEVEP